MENYVGEIRIFAGSYAPEGWHLCDGSLLNISEYQALFALLGTTYGGNGSANFGLPDLRGRLPVGQGNGTGLTPRVMGQSFGAEATSLTEANLPLHSHAMLATSSAATSTTPTGNVLAATQSNVYDIKTNPKAFDPRAVSSAGGGQTHANLMPSTGINFIIATTGIFPSRA